MRGNETEMDLCTNNLVSDFELSKQYAVDLPIHMKIYSWLQT